MATEPCALIRKYGIELDSHTERSNQTTNQIPTRTPVLTIHTGDVGEDLTFFPRRPRRRRLA